MKKEYNKLMKNEWTNNNNKDDILSNKRIINMGIIIQDRQLSSRVQFPVQFYRQVYLQVVLFPFLGQCSHFHAIHPFQQCRDQRDGSWHTNLWLHHHCWSVSVCWILAYLYQLPEYNNNIPRWNIKVHPQYHHVYFMIYVKYHLKNWQWNSV